MLTNEINKKRIMKNIIVVALLAAFTYGLCLAYERYAFYQQGESPRKAEIVTYNTKADVAIRLEKVSKECKAIDRTYVLEIINNNGLPKFARCGATFTLWPKYYQFKSTEEIDREILGKNNYIRSESLTRYLEQKLRDHNISKFSTCIPDPLAFKKIGFEDHGASYLTGEIDGFDLGSNCVDSSQFDNFGYKPTEISIRNNTVYIGTTLSKGQASFDELKQHVDNFIKNGMEIRKRVTKNIESIK